MYQLKTELKWPNDVLINKRKVAGILLESSVQGNEIERIVIGIGVNVNQITFQGQFNIPPTSIKLETNNSVERELLLAGILNNFELNLNTLLNNPEEIRKHWKAKCKMIGYKITITDNEKMIRGVFEDIDENGYIILRKDGMLEKIHSGDLSII